MYGTWCAPVVRLLYEQKGARFITGAEKVKDKRSLSFQNQMVDKSTKHQLFIDELARSSVQLLHHSLLTCAVFHTDPYY